MPPPEPPSLGLATLPTPLEEAPHLARQLGLARLMVKREDMAGYGLGGNKLRQIDYLLADALADGADWIVTTAGLQSNFCRSVAAACARTGIGCTLLLRGPADAKTEGNLLLDRVFGARIEFTAATDPWSQAIRDRLDAIAGALRSAGHTPKILQLTGPSAPLAVAAWIRGAEEFDRQANAAGFAPDELHLAAGSGLTLAGLALGFKALGRRCRVVGTSVQQPAERLRPWIVDSANAGAALLGIATRLSPADFDIADDRIGSGYGLPTPDAVAAVRLAGTCAGLVLDPVYTGKAFGALAAAAKPGRSFAFLHSGGTPGLFANAASFAETPA